MKLPEIAVKRPITTLMFFIAVFIFGVVSMFRLPLDVLPDIELPTLTVITVYPGASAQEVEQQVTKELEDILSSVSNLKSMRSSSKENVSFITLEFKWGGDLDAAASDVRDAVELRRRALPKDADSPVIYKISSAMMPILIYSVEADESFNALEKIIEDRISNRLKRVPGVGTLITIGQPEREIRISVDPFKLSAYNMSLVRISEALSLENMTIPGGAIKVGDNDLAVRIPGEYKTVDEIGGLVLSNLGGRIVRLRDVAAIEDGFKEKDELVRANGKKAVAIMIQKQSGANTLDVTKSVVGEIDAIQRTLPPDVTLKQTLDSSELVTGSIDNLASTILLAGIIVMIVVLLFLRELKSSFIIILTIPFSLIVGFIFMFVYGFSINIFSLMALAIAIGMVVDNAIVVLENITRHIDQGARPAEAAIFGSSEMGMAISASTLTTIAVFLPMVFMGGMVGILFKQLALLTSVTLAASLFTALTLTPMMASRLIPAKKNRKKRRSLIFTASEKLFVMVENAYGGMLRFSLHNRIIIIVASIAFFVWTLHIAKTVGTNYIPEFDAGDVQVVIETETGTSPRETARVAENIESIITEIAGKDLRSVYAVSGQTEKGVLTSVGFKEGKNYSSIGAKLVLPGFRERKAKDIADSIRVRVAALPEIESFTVTGGSLLGSVLTGGKSAISVRVMGTDYTSINGMSELIRSKLADQSFLTNVQTTIDRGNLELHVIVDRDKAQDMGLNTAMIGLTVRQSIYGADAGDFKEGGDDYSITVRYPSEARNNIENLDNIMLTTLTGRHVPLSSVATIVEDRGPVEIKHESQQRIVYVNADLNNISLGEAVARVQTILDDTETPDDVIVELGGQMEEQEESFSTLKLIFVLGLLLVYMIMASQFESLLDPFIIMFAVPLSIIGVIWAFKLTGTTLSVVTFIGIIMLLGIVVNNGIVMVDYTNLLRARGRSVVEAAVEAGRSRLRPVLMTAFTTIFAMVPLAMSTDMGSEMWSPLGITCIGGLLVSTLITLILIPVIYASMHFRTIRKEKERGR